MWAPAEPLRPADRIVAADIAVASIRSPAPRGAERTTGDPVPGRAHRGARVGRSSLSLPIAAAALVGTSPASVSPALRVAALCHARCLLARYASSGRLAIR